MQYTMPPSTDVLTGPQINALLPNVAWNFDVRPADDVLAGYGLVVYTPPTPPVLPPTQTDYVRAVQFTLDSKAAERNYDGILSACTYASSTVAKFKAEGQTCVNWRDAVWGKCYTVLAQVQSGAIAAPTVAGLLAQLPALVWPA